MFIYNATILNEGQVFQGSVLLKNGIIEKIFNSDRGLPSTTQWIDATGKFLLPGAIDTHVHFREPGLEYKATIASESKAALVGGITSFLEMPNTKPPTVDLDTLKWKIARAEEQSFANYGFYVAVTDDNFEDINQFVARAAGIKLFYGATTGNLLFNDPKKVRRLFEIARLPIAIHSEDQFVLHRSAQACESYQNLGILDRHLQCRPHKACVEATRKLLSLHEGTKAHIHFLHITTAQEVEFLTQTAKKGNVSFELCPHYLWFSTQKRYGKDTFLKVNPAIKTEADRLVLVGALRAGKNHTIGSDHAPHLVEEKLQPYEKKPSGVASIQHFLPAIFELFDREGINFADIPRFVSHGPALIFGLKQRGFIRPGYIADLVLVEKKPQVAGKIYHRCGWSIYQGMRLNYSVYATIVNGQIAYMDGQFTRPKVENIIPSSTIDKA